jgi:hypothetical protein
MNSTTCFSILLTPPYTTDSEIHLDAFIDWALRESRSPQYSPQAALELLDRAWDAQKLLWQLRSHHTYHYTNPSEYCASHIAPDQF